MQTREVQMYPDGRLDRCNAAAYTGFSVKTLAMHASAGTGPRFQKIGGRVFYRRDELDAWLSSFAVVNSTAQARAKKKLA
jgi:predicted DNA-binding transcriptional regulator AlpA